MVWAPAALKETAWGKVCVTSLGEFNTVLKICPSGLAGESATDNLPHFWQYNFIKCSLHLKKKKTLNKIEE